MISFNSKQVCTMSFFRVENSVNKIWAFSQIVKAREPLLNTSGLQFFKLFGLAGGHGYSLKSRFDKFGFLGIWESADHANSFFGGDLFQEFKSRSVEIYTMFMIPQSSRGTWNGFGDIKPTRERSIDNELVCVLTRATLKPRYIFRFFRQISKVVRDHTERKGLILTQGFSEMPFIEQATFSIWENEALMKDFAYRSVHRKVISMTRKHNGFREDMYMRMQPILTKGTWNGADPLKPYMMNME